MLNFVICDDDIRMIEKLSSVIEKVLLNHDYDAKIVFKTTNYDKLLEYISSNNVNVVFLDIEFSGCKENGLDIAKKIRKINKNCYLIFVTSHFEYIVNAYKFKRFDYIFKSSIDIENISSTLKRLFDDIYDSDAKFLKINNKNTFIDLKDILFIEKAGVKIIYHTYQTDYVSYNSFNKLTLPKNFIRCHKSFIVNIDNISNISYADNIIYLKNGSTCYIGPKYKNSLLEVIRYDSVS